MWGGRATVEWSSGGALALSPYAGDMGQAACLPTQRRWSTGGSGSSGVAARVATAGSGGGGSQVGPVASFLARVRVFLFCFFDSRLNLILLSSSFLLPQLDLHASVGV
jgi:hypothetical protein